MNNYSNRKMSPDLPIMRYLPKKGQHKISLSRLSNGEKGKIGEIATKLTMINFGYFQKNLLIGLIMVLMVFFGNTHF